MDVIRLTTNCKQNETKTIMVRLSSSSSELFGAFRMDFQERNGDADIENRLVDTAGEGEGDELRKWH